MLDTVTTLTDYLKVFGSFLARKVQSQAEPLFNPGTPWNNKLNQLLRKPFQAQGDTVMALAENFKHKDSGIVVGEMGCGKTLIACSVPFICQNGNPLRTLVMCPGHLVKKWQREILQTIPHAQARIIRTLQEIKTLPMAKPENPDYTILSKEQAKLGYSWRPSVNVRKGSPYCPSCGDVVMDTSQNIMTMGELEKRKMFCLSCKAPLWQADEKRFRRYALAEYIKKKLNGYFDFFIADEVHELKGGTTAQGNALGALASACTKTLVLTGTWSGGYADDSFYLLYRLSPQNLKEEGIEFSQLGKWMQRYGVLERIRRVPSDDNLCSRGKKPSFYVRRRPGISPGVFANHLLNKSVFLHLTDLAVQLPPISEEVVEISMNYALEDAYSRLETQLRDAVRRLLATGSKALLSTYLHSLLSYPDRPFGNAPILGMDGKIVATPINLPESVLYPKEEQLMEIVTKECEQGRKAFVYCQYTQTHDVTQRLKDILCKKGISTEILKSTVKPENREEWLQEKSPENAVIIGNPKLVETGLDLYDFPTLIFYQTGYSIFTLRQASRRSWRIGQEKPVKIYYLFYKNTMQEKALQLMGSKLEASLAIEGKFSEEGLMAMTQGEDTTTALAKALVEGLDIEDAQALWKKINQRNPQALPAQEEKHQEPVPSVETSPVRPVFVDLISFFGRKKQVKTVKVEELDSHTQEVAQYRLF